MTTDRAGFNVPEREGWRFPGPDLHWDTSLKPPIGGGRAGNLVIWRQALPHGSRPNRGTRPRMVQYIAMFPTEVEKRDGWL